MREVLLIKRMARSDYVAELIDVVMHVDAKNFATTCYVVMKYYEADQRISVQQLHRNSENLCDFAPAAAKPLQTATNNIAQASEQLPHAFCNAKQPFHTETAPNPQNHLQRTHKSRKTQAISGPSRILSYFTSKRRHYIFPL
ncbi:hypothetical protein L596_015322 [Steinernema carpocapsae]|nr:hypothetical protein L596_015322 [Steinernema carpocapsae]